MTLPILILYYQTIYKIYECWPNKVLKVIIMLCFLLTLLYRIICDKILLDTEILLSDKPQH